MPTVTKPETGKPDARLRGYCDSSQNEKKKHNMVNLSKWPKPKIIVAIDPDVEKNGVATVFPEIRELQVQTLPFAQTMDYLLELSNRYEAEGKPFKVIIEAGWQYRTNWHLDWRDSKEKAAAKGNNAGRNEQVSRLLGEMCEHWKIPYEFVKPLKKIWQGRDRKITAEELEQVTGKKIRTNQEGRDAALLAWTHADLPVQLDAVTLKGLFGK